MKRGALCGMDRPRGRGGKAPGGGRADGHGGVTAEGPRAASWRGARQGCGEEVGGGDWAPLTLSAG